MTNLEHTADDNPAIDRNFDKLKSLVIDTGGETVSIRFGAATDSWDGVGITSTGVTVTHGLGKTPVAVFTQSSTIGAHARPGTIGATTFNANLRTIDASVPAAGSVTIYWLAIG